MIEIDVRSRVPLYEQIIEAFKEKIISGEMAVDEKLPSVRELASDLAINPNTIQRAIRKLEEEQFVYSVRGRGSFVKVLDEGILKVQMDNILAEVQKSLFEAKKLGVDFDRINSLVKKIYDENV